MLEALGVERVFCVPGESFLAVLDALHDSPIDTVVSRQEGGAAMMAEATGKLTGRPGVCFVTRGPGATNASAGLHIARQDSTPMVLFVGQVQRAAREREAFQEIDFRRMFGEVAKWVADIDRADRVPEMVSRAFATATAGRPGPVVLSLSEDMLREAAEASVPAAPWTPVESHPSAADMAALEGLLAEARRPLAILGGSRWTADAVAQFTGFAERFRLPVACSFRRQMLFDNTHPNYAGDVGLGINPALAARVRDADVLLLVGGRMSESPSQSYTLLDIPEPRQTLIHVHPAAEELGRVYRPRLAIHASPAAFAAALETLLAPSSIPWAEETVAAHNEYLTWSEPPETIPGVVQMGRIVRWLRDTLPEEAIITNGAGNYTLWVHRYLRFRRFGTQAAPTAGSMGYGVPAAVAAQLTHPDRLVVCFAGDGCFLMHGQEFATMVQYGLPVIVIVVNNGMLGTIRMHQERDYPGRVSATDLRNPDFAALARAYGGHSETVADTESFAPAFGRARASGKPAIIELMLDPEAVTPTRTLTEVRSSG